MRRPPRLLALLPIALAMGCAGIAANPARFPYWLPTGDVIQTHAKPAGRGYFADFDPDAARLELTPDRGSARVGEQRVFVATVFDADGNARRKRRVEWILDGPGYIVETDESGITAGRGYLVNNQRAVSYTNHFGHTFDRGTRDPGDDFSIEPGQTWCVVSSAKTGETTLTAYAPEIQSVAKRTAIARVTWGDEGRVGKPPVPVATTALASDLPPGPARDEFTPVGRSLGGVPMTLDIRAPRQAQSGERFLAALELTNPGQAESPTATVTLTTPAGVELSDFAPKPSASSNGRTTWAFDRMPSNASRVVKFNVRAPDAEKMVLTADAVSDDGAKATTTATIILGRADLAVTATPPENRPAGEVVRVPVTVENRGSRPADNVSVFATLPQGENPGGRPIEKRFGTVPAGGRKTETFEFAPDRAGPWRVALNAAGDGVAARGEVSGVAGASLGAAAATTGLPLPPPLPPAMPPPPQAKGRPSVEVEWVRAPTTLGKGKLIRAVVSVSNRGTAAAENVELTVGGDGVEARDGVGPRDRTGNRLGGKLLFPALSRLEPGETVEYTVDLAGATIGPARIDASVTAKHQALPLREERSVRVANE